MSTGTSCTLWADGVRVADGSPGDDPLAPTALSGLQVVWGRDTTVDQPGASTCVVDLIDPPGGPSFAETLRPGTPVRVTAAGITWSDPTVPVWPDPGFEAAGVNVAYHASCDVTRSTHRAHGGARSARIHPDWSWRNWTTVWGPAPFVDPATGDPSAWDAIPATVAGQRWTYGAWVLVPVGVTVTVSPVLFSAPVAGSYSNVTGSPHVDVVGTGAWVLAQATMTPDLAGAWVGLRVTAHPVRGRDWDEVPGTWNAQTTTWDDAVDVFVDDVTVLGPAGGTTRTVLVFAGRVVQLGTAWDGDGPVLRVTCADFTAELDNRNVGDTPWLAEPMGTRFARVLTLSGQGVPGIVDASVAGIQVSWRDVDRQQATALLRELAASVDGVLWSAAHITTGPYLRVEDPRNRPPSTLLSKPGALVILSPNLAALQVQLSACDVARDAATWVQDVQDVTTRAEVSWLDQTVDPDTLAPAPTARTVAVIDAAAESARGARVIELNSQLATEADALGVAARLKERTAPGGWRMDALALDDDDVTGSDAAVARLLDLLDGTTRNGIGMALLDLPSWAPGTPTVALYVEGGSYAFTDGRWVLDLTVSNTAAQGQSATWNALPAAWRWNDFDPAISWDRMRGAGVAP